MPKNETDKYRKMESKSDQHGSRHRSQIGKITKNGMRKSKSGIGAEKGWQKCRILFGALGLSRRVLCRVGSNIPLGLFISRATTKHSNGKTAYKN